MVTNFILLILGSYFLGSISFSIVAGRLLKGIDIREHGSGNAGATNTLRILGKGPGISVFLLDIAKGIVPVLLAATYIEGYGDWPQIVCGIAAIIGHNWPIWYGFKGGKGIATTIGVIASVAFWPALLAGIIAIASIAINRYVSLGSLLFTGLLPVFIGLSNQVDVIPDSWSAELFGASIVIAIFAIVRHRSNIIKLWNGTENKLGAKKTT